MIYVYIKSCSSLNVEVSSVPGRRKYNAVRAESYKELEKRQREGARE